MELAQNEADELLKKSKFIMENGNFLPSYTIDIEKDFDVKFNLISEDKENTFLFRIQRSQKNSLKITLHHQDDETRLCLLRVDYNGSTHTNPVEILSPVPVKFHPYAGRILNCNHIHYHVEGYRTAAWAIPLDVDDSFCEKYITSKDFNANFVSAINNVSNVINLRSKILLTGHYKMML